MKVTELLSEEREYWADYPSLASSKSFANNVKSNVAEKFKISERSISVKQFLPQIDKFVQHWTIKIPNKVKGNEEFFMSMLTKLLTANLKERFKKLELRSSWVDKNQGTVRINFNLEEK